MPPESTTSHSRRISQGTAQSRSQPHPSTFLQVPQKKPHAPRSAFSLATDNTFVPKSALFAFEAIDLICSPLSRTSLCNHSVFTATSLTFPSPALCTMPRAATKSQKMTLTLNPKCPRIVLKCNSSSAVEHIAKYSAIPLLVATQLCLRENDVSGRPSASTRPLLCDFLDEASPTQSLSEYPTSSAVIGSSFGILNVTTFCASSHFPQRFHRSTGGSSQVRSMRRLDPTQ